MSGYDTEKGGVRIYKPSFNPPIGTKSLTVQIVVDRPLPFEFMVEPADVQQSGKNK